jgi:hypothetical protein
MWRQVNSDCSCAQSSSRILKLERRGGGGRRGKPKGEGGECYEDSSCFMAGDNQWTTIPVPNTSAAGTLGAGTVTVSDKCFWTGGICWVIFTGQENTYPTLPAFLKYIPSVKIRELDCSNSWSQWQYFEITVYYSIDFYVLLRVCVCVTVLLSGCDLWRCATSHSMTCSFFFNGATASIGSGPRHYRGFTITFRHTTLGKTPLDEWSAVRRHLYLATHLIAKSQTSSPPPPRNSNLQSQQASVGRPTP